MLLSSLHPFSKAAVPFQESTISPGGNARRDQDLRAQRRVHGRWGQRAVRSGGKMRGGAQAEEEEVAAAEEALVGRSKPANLRSDCLASSEHR